MLTYPLPLFEPIQQSSYALHLLTVRWRQRAARTYKAGRGRSRGVWQHAPDGGRGAKTQRARGKEIQQVRRTVMRKDGRAGACLVDGARTHTRSRPVRSSRRPRLAVTAATAVAVAA